MNTPCLASTVQLDAALEQLIRQREQAERAAPGRARSLRIARLYDLEARLWSVLFENTGVRLYWRAALAAEAHARGRADHWRHRAAAEVDAVPAKAIDAMTDAAAVADHGVACGRVSGRAMSVIEALVGSATTDGAPFAPSLADKTGGR